MKTTKIQGYWRGNSGRRSIGELWSEKEKWPSDPRALVLIFSDATPPVVLTLEEHREKVRAMLMEILLLKKGTLARPVNLVWEQDIKAIAADHGIDLTT